MDRNVAYNGLHHFGYGRCDVYYVHPMESNEDPQSLVFRYFDAGGVAPEIRWVSNTDLRIKIDHVAEVTKQVKKVGEINVSYDIVKQDHPRGYSEWAKTK